ncbi:MAG: hypothetical protein JO041_14810 [Acidobacteria bacterium]|nr:hypothetical protein [Acidobacteriota bacterium]
MKIDALRHLLYDAGYAARPYLTARHSTPEQAFRNVLQAARDELGPETYLLACWGVLPEAVGIASAGRLGTDGFGPHTLAEYNSWNNVVWRNDPDHVDIGGEGEDVIRPVLTSMAGAQLLLSDPVETYRDDRKLEGARRSSPVLFTIPGQLYDYDPTAADNLMRGLRNSNGGAEPGPIDAEQFGEVPQWWLMDISRPFENWSVLARLAWHDLPQAEVRFRDLGLPEDQDFAVFEFWTQKLLGTFRGSFPAPAQAAKEARVYSIRHLKPHPQLISTNRHITQGGPDLIRWEWLSDGRLAGESNVVQGDPYRLAVRVPGGFRIAGASMDGKPASIEPQEGWVAISTVPGKTGRVNWSVEFRQEEH